MGPKSCGDSRRWLYCHHYFGAKITSYIHTLWICERERYTGRERFIGTSLLLVKRMDLWLIPDLGLLQTVTSKVACDTDVSYSIYFLLFWKETGRAFGNRKLPPRLTNPFSPRPEPSLLSKTRVCVRVKLAMLQRLCVLVYRDGRPNVPYRAWTFHFTLPSALCRPPSKFRNFFLDAFSLCQLNK